MVLEQLRDRRFFANWDDYVTIERVSASERTLRKLIDDLLKLGPELTEESARAAVDECVRRFNTLDDGWICTVEREDIYEQVGSVIDCCGFGCDESWLDERHW
jgi:hypothetical protein